MGVEVGDTMTAVELMCRLGELVNQYGDHKLTVEADCQWFSVKGATLDPRDGTIEIELGGL